MFRLPKWTNPSANVSFDRLSTRFLLEASLWPRMTLLGQSLGSIFVALEACLHHPCPVFVDSMGYSFALVVARILAGSRTACYVHYPTISTDMLQRVQERRPSYNNSSTVTGSAGVSTLKLIYYKIFARVYGWTGGWFSRVTMVNSSWTKTHIESLWGVNTVLVYPPCLPRGEIEMVGLLLSSNLIF
jgi:alpha-1,2-mannosyltransferase